ncbi:MAG: NUDIX domain-containing protein [Candidatus Thiodiazotropha taylori]|nr:NUDIX domain-containing protein [Candidatus Thiodiazotropha endolucinida]MCW4229825.1 NUDIX domain-containing protein [Candidatus Thiodiazotropha taylori]
MKYNFKIVEIDPVYRGFLKINRYRLKHDLYMGGESETIIRERIEDIGAVSVLLYDPRQDKVVLVEQFRIGVAGYQNPPWMLETIGGLQDGDESDESVARRESLEEANCKIGRLKRICEFVVSPGISVDRIKLYCGEVDSTNAAGVHGLDHEGEDIRVVVMDADEAIGELYQGRANSTSVIIALQWLAIHRESLKQEWD